MPDRHRDGDGGCLLYLLVMLGVAFAVVPSTWEPTALVIGGIAKAAFWPVWFAFRLASYLTP